MTNKIIKHGLIVLKDNSFLINRKFNTNLFLMPGGKPEKNETIEQCLIREIKEEHQCNLDISTIKFFGECQESSKSSDSWSHPRRSSPNLSSEILQSVLVFEDKAANEPDTLISMKVYQGQIQGQPKINSEIEEQKWFTKYDDTSILSPIIKNQILPELIKQNLI